jgi:hypothetical protein
MNSVGSSSSGWTADGINPCKFCKKEAVNIGAEKIMCAVGTGTKRPGRWTSPVKVDGGGALSDFRHNDGVWQSPVAGEVSCSTKR